MSNLTGTTLNSMRGAAPGVYPNTINSQNADPQTAINTANIATNTADIATNTAAIAAGDPQTAINTANITTNTGNIATNTAAIAAGDPQTTTNTNNINTLFFAGNAQYRAVSGTLGTTGAGGDIFFTTSDFVDTGKWFHHLYCQLWVTADRTIVANAQALLTTDSTTAPPAQIQVQLHTDNVGAWSGLQALSMSIVGGQITLLWGATGQATTAAGYLISYKTI